MILLDPDLDAALAPTGPKSARSGVRGRAPSSTNDSKEGSIPSARSLGLFLARAQRAARLKGKVAVLLTTDAAIRRLNRRFRGKDKATDVLSFPAGGIGAEEMAGDLAISVAVARRQAVACGHPLSTEIKVLILHGVLHLAGFDHETDDGRMARREQLLRRELGLPVGLIERAERVPSGAKAPGSLAMGNVRAKAPGSLARGNVRAKARTLQAKAPTLQAKARTLQAPRTKAPTLQAPRTKASAFQAQANRPRKAESA